MREIKFRAWDGFKREMKEVREVHFDQYGGMDVYCSGDDINTPAKGGNVLMQSTGLTDKNGKEIYEGDIIESAVLLSETGEPIHTVVRWGENGWLANGSLSNHPQWMRNHQPEVIGNIYENPELLENK